jgi:hypothetical protein
VAVVEVDVAPQQGLLLSHPPPVRAGQPRAPEMSTCPRSRPRTMHRTSGGARNQNL